MWLKAAAKEARFQTNWTKRKSRQRRLESSTRHEIATALTTVLSAALHSDGRVKGFRPDVAGFIGYLIAHDAHHRGQIAMLAGDWAIQLSQKTMFGMWGSGARAERNRLSVQSIYSMRKAALLFNPLSGRRTNRRLVDVQQAMAVLREAGRHRNDF